VIVAGVIAWRGQQTTDQVSGANESGDLIRVDALVHAHGFAVDRGDPQRILIATHEGLFVLVDGRDLFRVGRSRDDLMGFSAHPRDPEVFWSSGHPRGGGNLGVQRSTDGGVRWRKIANGVRGPVDFHAMSVSGANFDLLYGWFGDALQRSTDGGESWEVVATTLRDVIALHTHPTDADTVYAATAGGFS